MSELGKVARKYPSHASCADDSNSHVVSFVLFGILFKLWQRRIHLVPRVRVRCPHIHLRVEPARIIQARSSDCDNVRVRVGLARNRRTAVRAKASMGLATALTGRGMEAQ